MSKITQFIRTSLTFIVLSITLTACQSTSSEQNLANSWQLVTLNGKTAGRGDSGKSLYIIFDQVSNKVNGYAGCNTFFGEYMMTANNPDSLHFSPLGMTRKYCADTANLESEFVNALSKTEQFQVSEHDLILLDAQGKQLARFKN